MLRLYNTLTHSIEEFKPINSPFVGLYSCGPTVYDYQHIGHMRTYVGVDILKRVLAANGYQVKHVMNITDVGHLVSDEDTGEDKMEKGARKYGKSVWEIAKMFEDQFWQSTDAVGIQRPSVVMHATDYIKEQIELVKTLEEKGYTYQIEDGVYFDTSQFPDYFALSRQNPDELKKGARVEFVEGKKNPADFALWKFSYPKGVSREDYLFTSEVKDKNTSEVLPARQMEWESPWGIGFPGWHIECSAMSMKELGPHFDIHTGGIDHISIHHSNEIAQSECATGQKFVNYWVHYNHMTVQGEKMSKSLGNFITVQDIEAKNYDPMALRYLYLQTHYRQEMNFTWEALDGAQKALNDLYEKAMIFGAFLQTPPDTRQPSEKVREAWEGFREAIQDDLNMPKALGFLHKGLKDVRDNFDEIFLLSKVDAILGLNLQKRGRELWSKENSIKLPQEVQELVQVREDFRKAGDWAAADEARKKIADLGFSIEDTKEGPYLTPISR